MLLSNMELLATAPGGVSKLRELILTLAVQGKLVPQDPADEPASVLLQKIRAEKDRLIAEGKIKRDKPLAEIAEEEKPFELPQGWEWVRLGDICAYIQRGKGPVYAESSEHRVVSQKCVRWYGLDLAPARFVTPESLSKYEPSRFLQAGDLLWNSTGTGTIGRACLVPVEHDNAGLVADSHVTVVRPVQISSWFLWRWIQSPYVQSEIEGSASGTTNQIELNTSTVVNHLVPLPPLVEQSRIVTRVEELMRLCDALEAKGQLEATQHAQLLSTLLGTLTASATPDELANHWQRVAQHFDLLLDRPQAIDALEQTLLQLAVRGLLVPQDPTDEPASVLLQKIRAEKDRLITEGKIKKDKPLPPVTDEEKPFELPMGWEWVRFGEYFFELCTGPFGSVIHKEDYVEGGVPLINPSHMIGGRISHDPSVSVSLEMSIQLRAYRLSPGDVVLARRGEVGRYALVTEAQDGWLCGTGSFFVKLHDSCNREFFGLVLEDPDLRRHLQGESVGSTMVNLNQRILVETSMALPPLPEQSRIVTRITQLRRLCFELRQRLAEREAVQARLAEALVQQVA